MKKLFVALLVGALVSSAAIAAVITNRIGQVVTVDANGVVTSITNPNVPGASTNTVVGISSSAQVDFATANSAGAIATKTPRQIGDFAIFLAGTNGAVWISAGVTTNDWILVGKSETL